MEQKRKKKKILIQKFSKDAGLLKQPHKVKNVAVTFLGMEKNNEIVWLEQANRADDKKVRFAIFNF